MTQTASQHQITSPWDVMDAASPIYLFDQLETTTMSPLCENGMTRIICTHGVLTSFDMFIQKKYCERVIGGNIDILEGHMTYPPYWILVETMIFQTNIKDTRSRGALTLQTPGRELKTNTSETGLPCVSQRLMEKWWKTHIPTTKYVSIHTKFTLIV